MALFLITLLLFVVNGPSVDRRTTTTLPLMRQPVQAQSILQARDLDHVKLFANDAQDDDTTAPTGSYNQERQPPPYNLNEKAINVFSNVFFYMNQGVAESARENMEAALQNMTVDDVYRKYVVEYPRGKWQGLVDFADLISARTSAIENFLDPLEEPVEDTLSKLGMIDLCCTNEKYNEIPKRSLPLCLVLGPSGSGKTCFALQYLRSLWALSGKKVVTLYLHPAKTGILFQTNTGEPVNGTLVARELVNWIRETSSSILKKNVFNLLDMHVCLVIDEAGSSSTKAWFEDKRMLTCLCNEATALAVSVTVVVVGTGITGRDVSSSKDAYIFRMRPWQSNDLSRLLVNKILYLRLAQGESIDTVAHAIFAHPILSALATNGRSASFLIDAVTTMSSRYSRLVWDVQLNEWAQALVTQVVEKYIASNGIEKLGISERRRVAASVFRAVRKMKEGDTSLPTFPELEERVIPAAESLIQYNLDRRGARLKILPGETFAFTLTPALVVVLYAMTGVYTPLVPGWKSEEELAALYAVRQSMLRSLESFVDDLTVSQGVERIYCQRKLDESLERIRLVRLQTKLESNAEIVSVPMVDSETIMMNRDITSFAAVIAPYTLIQAKHTINPSDLFHVNLYEEVKKCGLVKGKDCDTRLLRGLIAVWKNKLGTDIMKLKAARTKSSPTPTNEVNRNPQRSKAYPENVLSLVPSKDPIRYAVIEGKTARTMSIDNDLGPSMPTVTITEANVDEDMEIDVETLADSAQSAWIKFVKTRMRKGVQIKFLFTMCSHCG